MFGLVVWGLYGARIDLFVLGGVVGLWVDLNRLWGLLMGWYKYCL